MGKSTIEKRTENKVIFGEWLIIKEIGSGSFGTVMLCKNIITDVIAACKLESKNTSRASIVAEIDVLNFIQEKNIQVTNNPPTQKLVNKTRYIPKLNDECPHQRLRCPNLFGVYDDSQYHYVVMELMGETLSDLFKSQEQYFPWLTIASIGLQVVKRIAELHAFGYIHRDIKPENFMLGHANSKTKNLINLIDFGLCKRYWVNNKHIPFKDKRSMVGTARYTSINTHKGFEQSRRDDLISLGYMLLYFYYGGLLPWQGLINNPSGKNKEEYNRYDKIMRKKESLSLEVLCAKFPPVIYHYLTYCLNLEFFEQPDYAYLIGLWETYLQNYKSSADTEVPLENTEIYKKKIENEMKNAEANDVTQHHETTMNATLPDIPKNITKKNSKPEQSKLDDNKQKDIYNNSENNMPKSCWRRKRKKRGSFKP